jgi:hypothetical protein
LPSGKGDRGEGVVIETAADEAARALIGMLAPIPPLTMKYNRVVGFRQWSVRG